MSLEQMDKVGTDRAILSLSTPGVRYGSPEEVRNVVRMVSPHLCLWDDLLKLSGYCTSSVMPASNANSGTEPAGSNGHRPCR